MDTTERQTKRSATGTEEEQIPQDLTPEQLAEQKAERRAQREALRAQRDAAEREQELVDRTAKQKRFADTKANFDRIIKSWENRDDVPERVAQMKVYRNILHKRLVWGASDAVTHRSYDNGAYCLGGGEIDNLHKPMSLLLQYLKAEHKCAHDEATLKLREEIAAAQREAKTGEAPAAEKIIAKSDERPHAPELSA
jgi:hypothetical protein